MWKETHRGPQYVSHVGDGELRQGPWWVYRRDWWSRGCERDGRIFGRPNTGLRSTVTVCWYGGHRGVVCSSYPALWLTCCRCRGELLWVWEEEGRVWWYRRGDVFLPWRRWYIQWIMLRWVTWIWRIVTWRVRRWWCHQNGDPWSNGAVGVQAGGMVGIDVDCEDDIAVGADERGVIFIEGSYDFITVREWVVGGATPEKETKVYGATDMFEEATERFIMTCSGAGVEAGDSCDVVDNVGLAYHVGIDFFQPTNPTDLLDGWKNVSTLAFTFFVWYPLHDYVTVCTTSYKLNFSPGPKLIVPELRNLRRIAIPSYYILNENPEIVFFCANIF